MARKLFIPVVLGTARQEQESWHAARFVFDVVKKAGMASELIEVGDYGSARTVAPWQKDDASKKWSRIMARADGLIIVTPEYNHGYPGELKIFLDRLNKEYHRKPVALCGISSGGFGGTRVIQNLLPVLIDLRMVPIRTSVNFSRIGELFDGKGKLQDESYIEKTKAMLDELVWHAKVLKKGREKS